MVLVADKLGVVGGSVSSNNLGELAQRRLSADEQQAIVNPGVQYGRVVYKPGKPYSDGRWNGMLVYSATSHKNVVADANNKIYVIDEVEIKDDDVMGGSLWQVV